MQSDVQLYIGGKQLIIFNYFCFLFVLQVSIISIHGDEAPPNQVKKITQVNTYIIQAYVCGGGGMYQ